MYIIVFVCGFAVDFKSILGDLIIRMSRKDMVLLDSFLYVKLMEDSTLLNFSVIFSIFMFWNRKISISSIYLKYVVLLSSLYLKGPDSKKKMDGLISR